MAIKGRPVSKQGEKGQLKALKVVVLTVGVILLGAKGLASFKPAGRAQEAGQEVPDNPDLTQVSQPGAAYQCRESPFVPGCTQIF